MKSIYVVWFLLSVISEIFASGYLNFGGSEEESRQAGYYLSADSGTNVGPTDELTRTQRSFWKLLKHGLFGDCENCCNNCNYSLRNGNNCNSGNSLLPFQPWSPLHLWRPLEPLFGRLNYDNYETSNNAYDSSNNYGTGPYGDNSVNNPPNYDNNEPSIPDFPPAKPDYAIDNSHVTDEKYEPTAESEIPTYTNDAKGSKQLNKKVPQIIYQPIIYVSPQYQGSKNQAKEEETKYGEESKDEKPKLPTYETVSNEELKPSLYSSNADKIKSSEGSKHMQNTPEKLIPEITNPFSQTVPYTEDSVPSLSIPPTNPYVSSVSAVYNIITPSLLHSLTAANVPCLDENQSKDSLYPSNYIPLTNYPSKTPVTGTFAFPPAITTAPSSSYSHSYVQPIILTSDDQPYRECPELFIDYQRKINTNIPNFHGAREDGPFENRPHIHY